MRIRGTALKFGIFTAVSILFLALLYNTMANNVSGDVVEYDAVFSDVSGLRTGDDVRVAGVKVGRVQSIEVQGRDARIGFVLSKDQPLLTTTDLVIRYQNLLGQRYVSMVQTGRQGPALEPGATVPVDRTSPGFDLTALLNGFRPLFAVLKPEDVNKLAESIIKVLQGEGGTVEMLLKQTADLTGFLADREQLFDDVVTNLTPVLDNLSGQGTQLRSTVRELSRLMEGFARNRATFGRSLSKVSDLIGTTSGLLRDARRPLGNDVRKLRALSQMYADQGRLFGSSLEAFGNVVGIVGIGLSYESALNSYLCNLDGSILGVQFGTGTASSRQTKVCR
ncbi:MCE family protein [Nocardioides marmoribigeumensis]|uniref:Phospholipid/cholesterol/gamma-HCH transport system substrate-binding protein n=1 Tax=Nocardioides marmoribigeumensis TaxID=433649 RepID=A0ABU2BR60_9ACTN|nr:MCE family protein [Nocardioides marmoribigeumensis]MDR7361119.1 phospholipid/cholesterol/gamma-HCH transport system substrate-binding protein [Nocardioides marmoribigeumensis]